MSTFATRIENDADAARTIVQERVRLMGKILVETCHHKLMPDGETRLIRSVYRKPVFRGADIFVRVDKQLRKCGLKIVTVTDGDQSTEIFQLFMHD